MSNPSSAPPEEIVLQPFRPHLSRDTQHDTLEYLEADASVTVEQIPGSRIVLMRDSTSGKVVGVRIESYSSIPVIDA